MTHPLPEVLAAVELLPCPWCGGPGQLIVVNGSGEARCHLDNECDVNPTTSMMLYASKARDLWNTRTLKPGSEWLPIESAPRDAEVLFWIRPKTADETYHNTSGEPILTTGKPHASLCKFECWGSLWTATHWRHADPPIAGPQPPARGGESE